MANPFLLDKSQYVRKLGPVNQYIDQASNYLAISTGKPIEECKAFVRQQLVRKDLKIIDPPMIYLERQENGDREKKETTLMNYLRDSVKAGELIAPTFTTYIPPSIKESLMVKYIDANKKKRSVAKKEAQAAEAAGFTDLAVYKNNEQKNKKLKNNAVSGGMCSASTPLYNPTGHSTLTSVCRSTSGYGSANNEKFIGGNRHYFSPQIVMNNIVSIVSNTDYVKLQAVVDKYNLAQLSVDDVMDCISVSTNLYWINSAHMNKIVALVSKLTPIQKQAFVYTGDFYHLRKHNGAITKQFITEMIYKVVGSYDDAFGIVYKLPESNLNLAHQICSEEMIGMGKDYKALQGTQSLNTLVLTTLNIANVLDKYSDFIGAMWVTDNFPASVGNFPDSIRRTVLTSDTDSTIFTVQDWVIWFKNGLYFDQEAMSVAAVMIFLASETITHLLAKMSANFGISSERLFNIAMKNEFKFDIYVPTQVAKHYFARISCQEGNVKKHPENEIKGVHLISSNTPPKIKKKAHDLINNIMLTVNSGKKIKIKEILKDIGDTEREIIRSVEALETEYLRSSQIKTPSSYKHGEAAAPYASHLLWKEVFAPKYGEIAPPPYGAVKISTVLKTTADVNVWLENMEDKQLAERMVRWMARNNKKVLPNILLSTDAITMAGVPPEIASIIDTRNIVSDLSGMYYLILETLGFFIKNNKRTRLIHDFY